MKSFGHKNSILLCLLCFFTVQTNMFSQNISSVNVHITDAPIGFYLKLYELEINIPVLKDSTILSTEGFYSFQTPLNQDAFFVLKTSDGKSLPMLVQTGDSIYIATSSSDFQNPTIVDGSQATLTLIELEQNLAALIEKAEHLYKTKHPKTDSLFGVYVSQHRHYLEEIIAKNRLSLISLWAIQQSIGPVQFFNIEKDEALFENLSRTLLAAAPNNKNVRAFHQNVSNYLREKRLKDEIEKRVGIGKIAPDIVLLNPDSIPLRLYDLRGKTTLLKFWNPNCDLCREENKNLLSLYEKYHAVGFEVFSVSIGTVRDEWLYTLQNDETTVWHNVKIPEEGINIPNTQSHFVALYGVRSIPYSFLIDNEGTIIKKDFDMTTLEKWLKWYYSSPFSSD